MSFIRMLVLLICSKIIGFAQTDSIQQLTNFDPKTKIHTLIFINLLTHDTVRYKQSGHYEKINKNGIKIVEGQREGGIGHPCGCEPRKQGFWTYRYSNGQTDSIGNYICDSQTGKWQYFYNNGSIKKIQNFTIKETNFTRSLVLLNEDYEEYYETGQLNTQGKFKIISIKDSVDVLNPDTYNFDKKWEDTFKSIKSGVWIFYDRLGFITRKENYEN